MGWEDGRYDGRTNGMERQTDGRMEEGAINADVLCLSCSPSVIRPLQTLAHAPSSCLGQAIFCTSGLAIFARLYIHKMRLRFNDQFYDYAFIINTFYTIVSVRLVCTERMN